MILRFPVLFLQRIRIRIEIPLSPVCRTVDEGGPCPVYLARCNKTSEIQSFYYLEKHVVTKPAIRVATGCRHGNITVSKSNGSVNVGPFCLHWWCIVV